MSQMIKRIYWVDSLKAIGIFFVTLGHQVENESPELISYIYAFHIPLFFVVSGFLFDRERYKNTKYFISRKMKTLLVPYFCFAVFSYLFWLLVIRTLSIRGQSLTISPIRPLIGIVYAIGVQGWQIPLNIALWFIPCLFVTETIFWFLRTSIKEEYLLILIITSMGVIGFVGSKFMWLRLPWSLDVAFTAIVFYGLGVSLRSQISNWASLSNIKKIVLLIVLLFVHIKISLLNGMADMNINRYNNVLYFYVAALAGIGFYIILSVYIRENRLTNFIGKNTIIIIGLSGNSFFIIRGLIYLASKSVTRPVASLWCAMLFTVLEIVLLVPIMFAINKYLPFILGRIVEGRT